MACCNRQARSSESALRGLWKKHLPRRHIHTTSFVRPGEGLSYERKPRRPTRPLSMACTNRAQSFDFKGPFALPSR